MTLANVPLNCWKLWHTNGDYSQVSFSNPDFLYIYEKKNQIYNLIVFGY